MRAWARGNRYAAAEYPLERLLELKQGATAAAIVPSRDVANTIGQVVGEVARLRDAGAIDELIVVEGGSHDDTAERATAAGATVLAEDELLPQFGPARGKGDAMWRALSATEADVVAFVDGDTSEFGGHFVRALVGPLFEHSRLQLVKGAYRRPFTGQTGRVEDAGGRVSELMARPLLNHFFPELAALQQPLSGEFAARREALRAVPFMTGYGVEIQLLIDLYRRHGVEAIAQSDLGERINAHQPLADLGAMAFTILRTAVERAGGSVGEDAAYWRYRAGELDELTDRLVERPPLATLDDEGGTRP